VEDEMAVVVITGSNSGFGLEGALAFARNGDTVYASMRDPSKASRLQELAREEHLSINIRKLDITQPATFTAFVAEIVDEAGSLDVLVNNAGIVRPGALEDIPEAALRLVMETNLFGPLLLTRAVLPHMRAQGGGCIIMVSSLSGIAGLPGDLPYAASKFALEGATEALRHEVDRWGIRLALVEAGMYSTGIFDSYAAETVRLPDDYPQDSPYRALVENRLNEIHSRRSEAFDPRIVGELFVTIANSDGTQLRWPADAVATKVLKTMLGQDDAGRDEFLRMVAGTAWWSEGRNHAD
jgi:NAD(P)-dependent dehydrogenase (short-subunit alcohol dehydrogenase family)